MPRLLFFENATAPSTRSRRQLDTLAEAGWELTVVLRDGGGEPLPRGWTVHRVPFPRHPLQTALLAQLDAPLVRRAVRKAGGRLGLGKKGAARRGAVRAARARPTPTGRPRSFGDLPRLELLWYAVAQHAAAAPWDVAQAADLDALPPLVWAGEATNRPVIYDAHEAFSELDYLPEVYRVAWRELAGDFIPAADLVLAVSEGQRRLLRERWGAREVEVLPTYPVVGAAPATTVRRRLALDQSTPLAVHVGRVVANRRPELAVDLLAQLRELHVALVGDVAQDMRAQLAGRAEEQGVAGRLHFVEPVPMSELVGFLTDADVSLLLYAPSNPNLATAMPNKLYDGLAAGLLTVAAAGTEAGDYVVSRGVGATFEPDSAAALAVAVRRALTDEDVRTRAGELAPDVRWDSAADRYVSLLDGVRSRGAGTSD
jgi:glycosyltransferase involved in cell wall biosynthesis